MKRPLVAVVFPVTPSLVARPKFSTAARRAVWNRLCRSRPRPRPRKTSSTVDLAAARAGRLDESGQPDGRRFPNDLRALLGNDEAWQPCAEP